jgi:alpha-glucosidase
MAPDAAHRNVAAQSADPASILSHYRRLLQLRRSLPALQTGSYEHVEVGRADVLAYLRMEGEQTVLVVLGFEPETGQVRLPAPPPGRRWQVALSTHQPPREPGPDGRLELRPLEAVVLVAG